MSPPGLPADRTQVSRDLLASIERDGIPAPGPQGLTFDEFHSWERDAPLHVALEDWHGLVRVLRLQDAMWPGCTARDPGSAPFLVRCKSDSLLREAARCATLEARRR